MKFTVIGDSVDNEIKNQLNIVCKEILLQIPDTKSIILSGSYGYGEGPAKKVKNKVYPFNDYDIYVITESQIPANKVDEIATKSVNKLGFTGINYFYSFKKEEQTLEKNFYVDLKCLTPDKLKKVLPRLRFYKFKEYTKVIYGEDLRSLVPDFKLSQIPLSEPAKLLLDRMSQLIEYFSTEEKYDKEVLTYFIQQAYAAMLTSLSMLIHEYEPSYKTNMENLVKKYELRFSELKKTLPNLHLRIKKYIDWKLNPQKIPDKDIKKAWLICSNDLIEVSKYFFSKYLKKDIKTINQLSNEIKKMQSQFYAPYINYLIKRKIKISSEFLIKQLFPLLSVYLKYNYYQRLKLFKINYKKVLFNYYSPDSYILASAPYILTAITPKGISQENIDKAKNLLNKVYPVKSKNWEELSLEYANAYIAFFLQKLG